MSGTVLRILCYLFNPYNNSKREMLLPPNLEMRKWRHREVK